MPADGDQLDVAGTREVDLGVVATVPCCGGAKLDREESARLASREAPKIERDLSRGLSRYGRRRVFTVAAVRPRPYAIPAVLAVDSVAPSTPARVEAQDRPLLDDGCIAPRELAGGLTVRQLGLQSCVQPIVCWAAKPPSVIEIDQLLGGPAASSRRAAPTDASTLGGLGERWLQHVGRADAHVRERV